MSKIILMKGLPASGKSTRAKSIMDEGDNYIRINKDLLRKMLHFDKFNGRNEGFTQEASFALAQLFLNLGQNIIVDDTNLNPKTEARWRLFAETANTKIEIVELDTDVNTCIERDCGRDGEVGKSVIVKMALQYKDYLKGEKVVICDLDGTLADCSHRLRYARGPEKDWSKFFAGIEDDSLREDVAQQVLDTLTKNNAKLIFVSARPETYEDDTMRWLFYKGFPEGSYSALIMRNSNDKRDDTEVKSDIYDKYLKNLDIVSIFDDRPKVIRMWREKGLDVVDVGNGIDF